MKKILFILYIIIALSSCKAIIGIDYRKLTKELSLGMTKQEVINIMGKDYYIESLSETSEGKLEVITFYDVSSSSKEFTLYFSNDRLTEFHKYVPPYIPQEVHITTEKQALNSRIKNK